MANARIRLLTRGDDAGSCDSSNRAVLDAFQKGILRNTSVMVCCPAAREAAKLLATAPGLCVGLHVTLSAEWDNVKWGPVLPAAKVPHLVDEHGNFTPTPMVLHERKADVEQMLAEVRAQLQLARDLGFKIAYMDEHMGVGWVGGLRARLLELAEAEGLVAAEKIPHLPRAKDKNPDPVENLIGELASAPAGTYQYITHPGLDADDMRRMGHAGHQPGQIAAERDGDRRLLCDPRLIRACKDLGVEPTRFSDLGAKS